MLTSMILDKRIFSIALGHDVMPHVAAPVNNFSSSVFLFCRFGKVTFWGVCTITIIHGFNVCCRMSHISWAQKCHSKTAPNLFTGVIPYGWNCFVKSVNVNPTTTSTLIISLIFLYYNIFIWQLFFWRKHCGVWHLHCLWKMF